MQPLIDRCLRIHAVGQLLTLPMRSTVVILWPELASNASGTDAADTQGLDRPRAMK